MNDKKIRERAEKAVKKTVEKAQLAVKNKAKEQKSSATYLPVVPAGI